MFCVCLRIVVSNIYCIVFLFCFSSSVLPVSLDCPILIAPSIFSNVYFSVSLDCPYLIAPSVFSNFYFIIFSIKSYFSLYDIYSVIMLYAFNRLLGKIVLIE